MEEDLSRLIAGAFTGHLVFVDTEKMSPINLSIIREDKLKVRIVMDLPIFSTVTLFGRLSEQYEGIMICLDKKALPRSIVVTGLSGIIDEKPNAHGGLLKNGSLILNLKIQDSRFKESSHISILCERM